MCHCVFFFFLDYIDNYNGCIYNIVKKEGAYMEACKRAFGEEIEISKKDDKYSIDQVFVKWYMRYPEKPLSDKYFWNIVKETDQQKKKDMIDKLVDYASENSFETGFFAGDQEVEIGGFGGHSFVIDDQEIYYTFFNEIDRVINIFLENNKSVEDDWLSIIATAIYWAEIKYFGSGNQSRTNRLEILKNTCNRDDGRARVPSIKVLKGKGMAECVELASVAHNLFTLAGLKSYYICSKDCHFGDINSEYQSDGHAFELFVDKGVYRIFDLALMNVGKIKGDPIKDLMDDKPVIIEGNGLRKNSVYANYSKMKEVDGKDLK